MHLNPLKSKVIARLEFRADSPIHVGVGGDEVRRSLLRLPTGEFIIPASTWKGNFRRITEELAGSSKYEGITELAVKLYHEGRGGISYRGRNEEGKRVFEEFAVEEFASALRGQPSSRSRIRESREELRELLRGLGYEDWEIEEAELGRGLVRGMAENYIALHCPVGRLYGNRVMAGKLRFTDTIIELERVHQRAGVGIDRRSGRVEEGVLYFIEAIPRGVGLGLTIIADNLHPGEEDSRLFAETLRAIETLGLSIGGRKSAGLGHLKLDGGEFHILELEGDRDKLAIGNPLRKTDKMGLREFIEYLES